MQIPSLFTCLLLAIMPSGRNLFPQNATLQGIITDAITREALPGATIAAGDLMTSTDTAGFFYLPLPSGRQFDIVVSHAGYHTQHIPLRLSVGEIYALDIALIQSEGLLETATITAVKLDKPLSESTVSLDVLQSDFIHSINASAIDEALLKIPGVSAIDGQISIRGGSGFSYGAGSRVLVLLDGIPAVQADAGLLNWSDFPIENTAQIEMLKGAASALYGSSAMNGVVNFRTDYATDSSETSVSCFIKTWDSPKDPVKKWWGADSAGVVQPYETGVGFVHKRKSGRSDLTINGFGLIRESYNRETYSRRGRISPGFRFRANDRLSLSLNSNINFGSSSAFFIWGNDTDRAYQPGLNSITRSSGTLRFNFDPVIQYRDDADNRHKLLNRFFYFDRKNRSFYTEYQFQREMKRRKMVATAGMVAFFNTVEAKRYRGRYQTQNLAGYLQIDWKPSSRFNISAGLRYEENLLRSPELIRIDDTRTDTISGGLSRESKPVCRFGASYQPARQTFLRVSWGQGYRYPTIAEKFINNSFVSNNVIRPNPSLVSETGWTAEIGLKQGFNIDDWQGYVDLSGFWQEYRNMMEFVLADIKAYPDPGPPPTLRIETAFESQNSGDTRITGGELTVVARGNLGPGNLRILGGYTHISPRYKAFDKVSLNYGSSDSSNVLKYRFENMIKLDAVYTLKKISMGFSWQYNSEMRAVDGMFLGIIRGFPLPEELAPEFYSVRRFRESHLGFHVIDLRASCQINNNLKISVLCNNLLNEEYSYRPALLEAPRSFTLRIDWRMSHEK